MRSPITRFRNEVGGPNVSVRDLGRGRERGGGERERGGREGGREGGEEMGGEEEKRSKVEKNFGENKK